MKNVIAGFALIIGCYSFAQQTDYVDFIDIRAALTIVPDSSLVKGSASYRFKILKPVDSIFIDAKNISVNTLITDQGNNGLSFSNDMSKIWIKNAFKTDSTYVFNLQYKATPSKALYFLKRNDQWNIWTQGQGKYTSNWLPSFDDVNEKTTFDLTFIFEEGYTILSNGKKSSKRPGTELEPHSVRYKTENPMSSYLAALVIGEYNKKTEVSESGIPLEFYYYPEDSLKVEPTYRYSIRMFDFLENEIGYEYPWQNYKQIPVHDFLYAGMENTSLTIFSDAFVVDSTGYNDKNYVNVNAHELAHQWFGDLVTATSGEHHWLQEGFATYYALLTERAIFGDDYYQFKLYESAQDLGRQDMAEQGTSLLNPKASSLTFYQRGAWVLHALRAKVGDEVFKQAVVNYLNKHQFENVETSDFMAEVEALYEKTLTDFVSKWIAAKEFPFDDAIALLKSESSFVNEYTMVNCEIKDSKCADYLKYGISDEAKIKVIAQAPELVTNDTFKSSLKVRQAIAQYVTTIPASLKLNFESLLKDASYLTIESALYSLWLNFPEERSKYLSITKDVYGFGDYNVRLLWLVLNLNTLEYQSDKTETLYAELVGYTGPNYNAEVRMTAFKYLDLIKSCNAQCQTNLELAKSHHNWRMVTFVKNMEQRLKQKK